MTDDCEDDDDENMWECADAVEGTPMHDEEQDDDSTAPDNLLMKRVVPRIPTLNEQTKRRRTPGMRQACRHAHRNSLG